MNAETVNAASKAGRAKAESEQLDDLTKIYLRLITAAGRRAAEAFRQQVALVAATNPKWVPPANNLIDAEQLTADGKRKTAGPHAEILRTVTASDVIGIDWTIAHPTSQMLLASVAARLDTLNAALRLQVSETIQDGYQQGWSVAQTAEAIVAKVDSVAPARAAMYARTDLNALANGGSLMAAQIAGVAAKSWLTAGDDLVRETHADADGQTVPVDQPFDIGGEQGMYPGDPDLSDEEALNCRCTLVYADSLSGSTMPGDFMDLYNRRVVSPRDKGGGGGVLAGAVPFRVEVPVQRAPVTKVNVEPPIVHVHSEQAPPDMTAVAAALSEIAPLVASAVAEGQRTDLVQALDAFREAAAREHPPASVTVAAADVQPPDVSGIGPSIVDGFSPAAQQLLAVLRDILAALTAKRSRIVRVTRDRSGEITDLTIEEA